jgi:hypothetical protein
MLRNALLICCVVFAAILVGCNKTETTTTSNANTGSTAANSNKAAGTTSTGTTSTTASTAGEKVGIPECDDFLTKYEACVTGKVPEVARAQYETSLKQLRESWKKLAANPQTKGTLAAACKQSKESTEAALKTYGCSW